MRARCLELVDKSVAAMIAAIEIYNKPDFKYREETYSVLSVNSGLLKKGSTGWIQILRTSGAMSSQALGYRAASEPAISSFHMFLRLIQWQRGHC